MILIRTNVKLKTLEHSKPLIHLFNGIVYNLMFLEGICFRLQSLLQKLTFSYPIILQDMYSLADGVKCLECSLVLLHNQVVELFIDFIHYAEILLS